MGGLRDGNKGWPQAVKKVDWLATDMDGQKAEEMVEQMVSQMEVREVEWLDQLKVIRSAQIGVVKKVEAQDYWMDGKMVSQVDEKMGKKQAPQTGRSWVDLQAEEKDKMMAAMTDEGMVFDQVQRMVAMKGFVAVEQMADQLVSTITVSKLADQWVDDQDDGQVDMKDAEQVDRKDVVWAVSKAGMMVVETVPSQGVLWDELDELMASGLVEKHCCQYR